MTKSPHRLVEGSILSAYAINAHKAFIYIRGEFAWLTPKLWRAIDEAEQAGYLGKSCFGSGYELDIVVHLGAGAYICGEETALLDSLEGKRGQPRVKPPFPAVEGLYSCPTVVNNVETIMNVPFIVKNGPDWYRQWGTEKSTGTKVFSISGMVNRPGNYEIEMGMPLSAFLEECAGGMRDGYALKAVIPGGSSVPWLPKEKIDTPLDFESLNEAGTFLGSGAAIVIDEGICVVDALLNLIHFYRHESCGKCTPCREGGNWMETILHRLENGEGSMEDVHDLRTIADQILGRSLCALGDAAAMPVQSVLDLYPGEFEYHVIEKRCLVNRRRDAVERARKGEPVLV
jgi:NADH-quinone oxidoreductase subunit F